MMRMAFFRQPLLVSVGTGNAALHIVLVFRSRALRERLSGLLARNPSDLVELPKVPHKERHVLSPDEAQDFLKAAAVMPHGLIFEFALLTGMRPEEYLAFQWSDVNLTTGATQIKRALIRHKKSWSFEEPKTVCNRRTVFLPAPLLRKLISHKRKQAET